MYMRAVRTYFVWLGCHKDLEFFVTEVSIDFFVVFLCQLSMIRPCILNANIFQTLDHEIHIFSKVHVHYCVLVPYNSTYFSGSIHPYYMALSHRDWELPNSRI